MPDGDIVLFILVQVQVVALTVFVLTRDLGKARSTASVAPASAAWVALEAHDHEHVWPAEPFGSSENGQMQNYRCQVCGAITSKAGSA